MSAMGGTTRYRLDMIEKGIPMPAVKSRYHLGNRRNIRGVLEAMEIGDSILVEDCERASFFNISYRLAPKLFVSKRVTNGIRFWRYA